MIVDSHLHLWDRTRSPYAWLAQAPVALRRTFTIEQARGLLHSAGVGAAVLVQADESRADTVLMLEASADPLIAAVVASVPLEDPDATWTELEWLSTRRPVRGVRVLNHDRPDPGFLLGAAVARSVELVGEAGLSFDVVAVDLAQLSAAVLFADAHPAVPLVLDHLGKPPLGGSAEGMREWSRLLRALGERPNVCAKLSGVTHRGTRAPHPEELAPVLDVALEAFGAERLMLGSDWPVSTALEDAQDDTLPGSWSPMLHSLHRLSDHERALVESGTAARVYRWEPPR